MFHAEALTFQEFAVREPVPLSTVHQAVLEFLRGRDDAVVFGAQAVNAYVDEPRMTQDVDLLSPRAEALANELRAELARRFHLAIRIRRVKKGLGFRLFQSRKGGSRHLVDVRSVEELPPARRVAGVLVLEPVELIASKVVAYRRRRGQPKSGSDWRDVAMLLLAFPELKRDPGPVSERLRTDAEPEVLETWRELVDQEIRTGDEDDEFD